PASQQRPRSSKSIKHTKIFEMVMQILSSSTLSPPNTSPTFSIAELADTFAFALPTTNNPFINATMHNHSTEVAHSQWYQTKFICIVAVGTIFAILTTVGNLMVMVSFKIDKQLQTISNYFLFSLAVADIAIGIISIPLMTYYLAVDTSWGIGYTMCQFWLCLDYFMSNASVLNLLLISFDRYFSVTRPLTYRPRRTAKKALTMIASTYIISLILWPPWIISWPHIEGRFTSPDKCVVQFIETNQFASVGTAIAAFYLPLAIMIFLYSRVYYETKKRQKEVSRLQAGQQLVSLIASTSRLAGATNATLRGSLNKRDLQSTTSSSSLTAKNSFRRNQLLPEINYTSKVRRNSTRRKRSCLKTCLGKSEISSDESSDVGHVNADDASVGSSFYSTHGQSKQSPPTSPLAATLKDESRSVSETSARPWNESGHFRTRNVDRPPTYTVLIELKDAEGKRPSVRLSSCETDGVPRSPDSPNADRNKKNRTRSMSDTSDKIKELRKSIIQNEAAANGKSPNKHSMKDKDYQRKSDKERRKNERKQESKAAKTLSAILFAFIITWTPYNVIVCWEAFYKNSIPEVYFHIGYCLCYINSTINPLCYALCNARFRMTYLRILMGRWRQERPGLMRNAYLLRI
uniref:G-protein coupled receptors family 1 profile domain-containing protein n=1 Tax=Parascaris univalens TaxID=6257 RepID=A0A915BSK2_PARUN